MDEVRFTDIEHLEFDLQQHPRRMFQNVDPAHHLRDTVAYLLEQRHADYALSAKGNQAAPLAWVHAALPPAVPEAQEHVQTERSHGGIIRSSVWTAPLPD
ncbi:MULTISPECIES: hypothetical protein [Streptomyces]|uniref:hypothetical protein n=1 Tax=Streptomyces TaxID=1883 RepID=UPI000BE243FE|nr:hypothetical protein [Streptomyces sp. 1222.2]